MKILHINKFMYRRGGAESYMFDVAALQQDRGHTVEFWGMRHNENAAFTYQDNFVDEVEFGEHETSLQEQVRIVSRMVWSTSARRRLGRVLDAFMPDVIHAHNIYHQLSPSILSLAASKGVPVVLTMHDYKLVCPSYQLLAGDEICERCVTGSAMNALRQRCNRGSLGASAAVAIESTLHRSFRAYAPISTLIGPSRFMTDVVTRSGRYRQPIRHIPHFTELDRAQADPASSSMVLFAGRLSGEKGLDVLLDAAALLDSTHSPATIAIAGDGPDADALKAKGAAISNVEFHGRLPKEGVDQLLRQAAAVVVPSVWHENQPMIILEALAAGLPIIASDIGGIGELVHDGESGVLVPPGDAGRLAKAIDRVLALPPSQRTQMGLASRQLAIDEFDATKHLDALEQTYAHARSGETQ